MHHIYRALCVVVAIALTGSPLFALPVDPNLNLDATYGLQPRPANFQYTPSPSDWRDINIYQIFTDRFADGDPNNNQSTAMGINRSGWYVGNRTDSESRNYHHGGDWKGLKNNLDYLSNMGVNAIWISGVQMNDQGKDTRFTPYHMYHPTDFFNVDPAMGTFQELKDLVDEAHARGIYVIFDVVINHTADKNGLLNNSDDKGYWENGGPNFGWWNSNKKHPYPFDDLQWFHNNGTINNWDRWPEYINGQFKGTDDLATEKSHVSYWLTEAFKNLIDSTDCDGFRVDAIKHVEYNWIKGWADDIRKHAATKGKNDFILFGEYFSYDNGTLASYCSDPGYSFNSALFFPMSQNIKSVFIDGQGSGQLTQQLNNKGTYGEGANRLVTFIDNHDVNRIGLQAGGNVGHIEWVMPPALTFLYTATPVPCLFYGTEHAFQQGGHWNGSSAGTDYDDGDWQRECMFDRGFQPGPAQGNKLAATNAPLYQHIKKLNKARKDYKSLTRGNFTQRWDSQGQGPYAYTRAYNDQEALVALNTSDNNATLQPAVGKPNGTQYVNIWDANDKLTVSGGKINVSLGGKATKIYVAGGSEPTNPADINVNKSGGNYNFSYKPNDGPLKGSSSISVWIKADDGSYIEYVMTNNNGTFTTSYPLPAGTSQIKYYFQSGSKYDNNGGGNYIMDTAPGFKMDGEFDSQNYLVSDNGMRIYAAVSGNKLYTATWSTKGGANDHFIYITDKFGDPIAQPWAKEGKVYGKFDGTTNSKPWIAANPTNEYRTGFGASGKSAMGVSGKALEGELDLVQVFGSVPKIVYIAVGAYGRTDGSPLLSQAPPMWDGGSDINVTEYQPLHIDSIRDEDFDGFFDKGAPVLKTVVNGNEADANYGLRRFFIDELLRDSGEITVKLKINAPPGAIVSNVEAFTNLNRRDFAKMEEDPATVTTTSADTYYRAYPMTGPDGTGYYSVTIPVDRCGAYRLQARYKINGGDYIYYTDNAQRRDCAVVVSPKKALTANMYEVNPLTVEAKNSTFAGRSTFLDLVNDPAIPGESGGYDGRPDALNKDHYAGIGVNMLWLQPIHPIGVEGRDIDPQTGLAFDPGSPYAVRDYWSVAPMLGRANTAENAMQEFQTFVSRLDSWGVDVMMDGTFNHSSPDAIMGQGAVDLGLTQAPATLIRNYDTRWYAKEGFPAQPAATINEIAIAPDRNDFGNWTDVREFYFGNYDTLVKVKGTQNPNNSYPDNASRQEYLSERDEFFGHTDYTRKVWEYFAYYPIYWLEKSGHPKGTPKEQSYKGIDGLRCDFAQGLPSQFWEYCINKTRSVKWDFLFMAESLDGYRDVAGSKRHGVGYRSARHFDILNENITFYWRDQFFGFPQNGGAGTPATPNTGNTYNAYDIRRGAFEDIVLLNNLVSHDEVFPHNNVYSLAYAYAQIASLNGIPMLFYGQEAGAQNSKTGYSASEANFGAINSNNNFDKYEQNFGKNIPSFKVYNNMTKIWDGANRNWGLQDFYGRINKTRKNSPALQSPNIYFLGKKDGSGFDSKIYAVAKFQKVGLSAGKQDVMLIFVNNDYTKNASPAATFDLSATAPGSTNNYFGIEPAKTYNVKDLLSDTPNEYVWETPRTGADIIANGMYVGLPYKGRHAHYLRLIDQDPNAYQDLDGDGIYDDVDDDMDGDGIPNWYENANGMDPRSAVGVNGADGDLDGDGYSNYAEFIAGTKANDRNSKLRVTEFTAGAGQVTLSWKSVPGNNYKVRYSYELTSGWSDLDKGLVTALGNDTEVTISVPEQATKVFYTVTAVR